MYIVPSAEGHGDEAAAAVLSRYWVAEEVKTGLFDDETLCSVGATLRSVFGVEGGDCVAADPGGEPLPVLEPPLESVRPPVAEVANADAVFEAESMEVIPGETMLVSLETLAVRDICEIVLKLPCKYRLADTILVAAS